MSAETEQMECVLFDLDGTLADSIDLVADAYRQAFKVHVGRPMPSDDPDEVRSFLTRRFVETLGLYLPPGREDAFAATYNEWYATARPQRLRAFPFVCETLVTLRQRGYRLGVVTNKETVRTGPDLEFLGLGDLMEVTVATEDTPHRKPHPGPILLALERLGVSPQRACYVGDNPVDIQAGRAAGTKTAAALWGRLYANSDLLAEHPDLILRSITDLLSSCPQRNGVL